MIATTTTTTTPVLPLLLLLLPPSNITLFFPVQVFSAAPDGLNEEDGGNIRVGLFLSV